MAKLIIIILLLFISTAYATPGHFKEWFPQYSSILKTTMESCMTAYNAYKDEIPCPLPERDVGCRSGKVVDCLLEETTESLKANMAAGSVILGLLPTTLCLVGSTTVETSILARRRPLLSLLLALGAPAVSPTRTFEYRDPVELLRKKSDSVNAPRLTPISAGVTVALQYIFASLAIFNLAHVSWELSIKTVCSFSSESEFQPMLWTFLSVVMHILGYLAMILRFGYLISESPPDESLWVRWLQTEFKPATRQPPATLYPKHETYWFIFCSWLTSTSTVLYVMYGTLVFSSILFISARDALLVGARYLASTLVCRIILMIEVMGMRDTLGIEEDKPFHKMLAESRASTREQQSFEKKV